MPIDQTSIAQHLDLSTRQTREVLQRLNLDAKTHTLDQIRTAYIRDLREKAAGRTGSKRDAIDDGRLREVLAKAVMLELEFAQKSGQLVPVEAQEQYLARLATECRTTFTGAIERLAAAIESQHGIALDADLIHETTTAALRAIADYHHKLAADDGEAGDQMGATERNQHD
jgi:hypothetical protein